MLHEYTEQSAHALKITNNKLILNIKNQKEIFIYSNDEN